jgi:hypothetical protein
VFLISVLLFVAGIVWCWVVITRFRSDLEEFRAIKETPRRAAIVLIWALTALILPLVLSFGLGIVWNIVRGVRSLM